MVECKNCLHNGVCTLWRTAEMQDARSYTVGENGGECREFLDKSRLVEVPCNLGDTVWVTNRTKKSVFENKVHGIYIAGTGKCVNTIRVEYTNRLGEKSYRKFTWAQFGKILFFTKEEAEAALKKKGETNEHQT